MNFNGNHTGLRSYTPNDFILITNNNNTDYAGETPNISDKWNDIFLNSRNIDIQSSVSESTKSFGNSCGSSSSCSSTSLEGFNKEPHSNNDMSPTEKDILLLHGDFPQRKSDGLCRITLSNKPLTLEHFLNDQELAGNVKMEEGSRLAEESEKRDHFDTLPENSKSRLNIEDFDILGTMKLSNGENGMLKSVKGTVRGYKNMVRRYSASFNSKGHVIPTLGLQSSSEDEIIIIYTTSMGAVRTTTEACAYVRKVFQNRGLPFDERDVFIHKEHQKEMQSRLGKSVSLPQVFINGIHVGGRKEIEELNETGKISSLISGYQRRYGVKPCERCGDKRFINCLSCGGSRRSRRHRVNREICALRCTKCNENGLVSCPDCTAQDNKD